MKLTKRIFVAFLCFAVTIATAHGGDIKCDDLAYRTAHPEKCTDTNDTRQSHTFTILGGAAGAIGGALAAVGLLSSGGGGHSSVIVTPAGPAAPRIPGYPAPQLGGNRPDVLDDLDADTLNKIRSDAAYHNNATQYDTIGAAYARGRGYTGMGTTIAVMDTGREHWHGSMVSGIIDEFIAPDADIQRYKIANTASDFLSWADIGKTFATVVGNADVINNSWNISYGADTIYSREHIAAITDAGFINAISDAATHGAILVWAAGNDGAMQSGALSALPAVMPELRGHFINVVAWDSETGMLAEYSNACGVTMNWCITAPGSEMSGDGYKASGTSFAAPQVSAAIAILRQEFPYMTPEQITELLFVTATDLGAPGVDEIYGHGMMDLERATRPVGDAVIAGTNGATMPLRAAHINGAIAKRLQSADIQFAYFDAFGRPFHAKLADNVRIRNRGLGFDRLRGDARLSMHIGPMELGFSKSDFLAGDGFLQTDGGATTTFIATDNRFNIGDIEIFQRTQFGIARPHPAPESIIMDFSRATTAAVTVGARMGDWTFRVGVPETIIDGNMDLRIPTGRAASGAVIYTDRNISIASAPAFEYAIGYKFITFGFIDNPIGRDEIYMITKSKIAF